MRCVNPDVVDDHRYPGGGRGHRAAAEGCREATTHRQVKDNKEPMMQRVVPVGCIDLVGVYREEVDPVQVPTDLLGRRTAVILHAVRVEPRLAAWAWTLPATDAAELVAGPARSRAAVEGCELRVQSIDVLHDIDLADAGPVEIVAAERSSEHPERRPISQSRAACDIGLLDRRLHG